MTTKRTVALEDIRCRWGSIRKKASPSVTSLFLASISFATCLATAVLQAWNWNSPSLSSGLTGLLAVVHACKRTASEQVNHYETKTLPVTTRGGPSAGVTSGTPFIGISEPPDKRGQVTTTNVVQGWVRYIIETSPETRLFRPENKLAKREGRRRGLWHGEKLRCQTKHCNEKYLAPQPLTGVSHRSAGSQRHFLIFKTVTTTKGNHNETSPYVSSSLRFSVVKTCILSEKLGVSDPVKERRLTTAKGHENHKQTLPQASRRSWFAFGRRRLASTCNSVITPSENVT